MRPIICLKSFAFSLQQASQKKIPQQLWGWRVKWIIREAELRIPEGVLGCRANNSMPTVAPKGDFLALSPKSGSGPVLQAGGLV